MRAVFVSFVLLLFTALPASGRQADQEQVRDDRSAAETRLVESAKRLSAATLSGGPGWQSYRDLLHDDFNRWSAGQGVWNRTRTVDGIKEWWEAGNRLSSTQEEILSLQIVGTTAVIRKSIHERYVDAEGQASGEFSGFVTQVWVAGEQGWRLLAATIQRGE